MRAELERLLERIGEASTLAEYSRAARELEAFRPHLRPARIALLSSFTLSPLKPFLEIESARYGLAAEIYCGPFNAVRQELLDAAAGCAQHRPDVIFIAEQLESVSPRLWDDYLLLDSATREAESERIRSGLISGIEGYRARSEAAFVIHNFTLPRAPLLGIYESMAAQSQTRTIRELNCRLADDLRAIPDVYVLDFDRLCAGIGYANWRDERMWQLAKAPLTPQALTALARTQAAYLKAILSPAAKCLVLDLDNTLWGGVVGEAGLAGIQLGRNFPGSVFREFQQAILHLYRRGVLLAINSKNNPEDARQVLEKHPDMLLRPDHFASIRCNWRDKPANMREIASELNLGLDSLAFFDDNPAERALMRQAIPEVLTLEVPSDPLQFAPFLAGLHIFDRLGQTDEDRRRGVLYRQQAQRQRFQEECGSLEDFLHGLEMSVEIRPVDDFTLPRILELIHKTNQFNLTTRRHSASRVAEMLADPGWALFSARLHDRFGDQGVIGAAIVQTVSATARIDTLLLSCRVIGRSVETALLCFLVRWAESRGIERLEGEYIPTPKNMPAADFYGRHGFESAGPGLWSLALKQNRLTWPSYIREGEVDEYIVSRAHG